MKQQFFTPNGYQTVEAPENKAYTFVVIVNNDGQWSPLSFTTTTEYSHGYNSWLGRVYGQIEDHQEWEIRPVIRYENPTMIHAQLTAAIAELADIAADKVEHQLSHIRMLTTKYSASINREQFNREAEEANVTA